MAYLFLINWSKALFTCNKVQPNMSSLFCWTHVHFWGHWYPCFGLLVMSPLGFKARVGSLIRTWQRCTWYTFLETHLWCNTYQPLSDQHGSWSLSHMHVSAEVGCGTWSLVYIYNQHRCFSATFKGLFTPNINQSESEKDQRINDKHQKMFAFDRYEWAFTSLIEPIPQTMTTSQ